MDRRGFVKFLALMGAGAAAMPEQVAAFERYYEVNTPKAPHGLVAVDDILVCGTASKSLVLRVHIFTGTHLAFHFAINAFGGIYRWAAMPNQVVMALARDLRWDIEGGNGNEQSFEGHIGFVDQGGLRHMRRLDSPRGVLA